MRQWTREIEYNRGERIIRHISAAYRLISEDSCLFFVGSTHVDVSRIIGALQEEGASEIEGPKEIIPWNLKLNPVAWFIPRSRQFFFFLNQGGSLSDCVELLDNYLQVDIIVVPRSAAKSVKLLFQRGTYSRLSPEIFQRDDHFTYGFDTDHPEYETGIQEFVSLGPKAPKSLTSILSLQDE